MAKFDERTIANMEVALETSFRDQPHGGDHESRKRVARKLLQSAKSGNPTLGGLEVVAKTALNDTAQRKAQLVQERHRNQFIPGGR
jgi:hypothetical protein